MVFLLPCSSTVADLDFIIDIIKLLVLKCHIIKSPVNIKECSESHTRVQDGSFNFVNKFVKGCFSGGALCETMWGFKIWPF